VRVRVCMCVCVCVRVCVLGGGVYVGVTLYVCVWSVRSLFIFQHKLSGIVVTKKVRKQTVFI